MNKWFKVFVISGLSLLVIGIIWEIIEMLIDHNCYQLEPNEFYNSSICERYWKEK